MADGRPVMICYDGSDQAAEAIGRAGELLGPRRAVVVYVWQPLAVLIAQGGFGALAGRAVVPDDEAQEEAVAAEVLGRGVELAREAGFEAEGRSVRTATSIPEGIIDASAELGAELIVMGSRGLTGVKSLLLGSVSHEVVQRARCATLTVPSAALGGARGAAAI